MSQSTTVLLRSPQNPLLKDVRRAVTRAELTRDGCVVAESFHLLEEALRGELKIQAVLAAASVRDTVQNHVQRLCGMRLYVLPDPLFRELATTENSQGVIALVKPPVWRTEQLFRGSAMVVVLDGIQDPGNAGAIVRAAEAFGATGCLFLKGTVSPYNPKALRASAGSMFRLPLIACMDGELALAALRQRRLDLYAAMPSAGKAPREADLARRFALIVGSESRGVSGKLRSSALDLRIPMIAVESLNVAMATGIILYEAHRQRALR